MRPLGFAFYIFLSFLVSLPAQSETLHEALAAAYANNAELNAERAAMRATDEAVPQALSGYRPRIDAFASAGADYSDPVGGPGQEKRGAALGISVTQPLFNGFRTENGVKAAEAAVRASRERLRNLEQNVLYDTVIAYMDVVQNSAVLSLRRSNVSFLSEQVRAASERLEVGEATRTDVAQAEAALAAARAQVSAAEAALQAAVGSYQQVVGHKPKNLAGKSGADALLPKSLDAAITASRADHPAILAAIHNADTAGFNVEIAEGALLPQLSLEANVQQGWERGDQARSGMSASIMGRLSIPLYEGGQNYSQVREAKETLGQRRIEVDVARAQVHAALISAWSGREAAEAQVRAAHAQIRALQLALEGVIEEQKVGQRTTLDVLDAQNDVVNARITLINAERDRVVAAYAILSSMGRLSAERLGLKVAVYKPEHHYKAVRDKWIGLRTPDGR